MLAVRFYQDKQKVISYMLISIAAWDVYFIFCITTFLIFLFIIFTRIVK